MAFVPLKILPNPPPSVSFSCSPLFLSISPFPNSRTNIKLNAHLTTHQTFLYNEEEEEEEEDEEYPEAQLPITKKKKKKKLRPSFYDQTIERWSRKVSSQRSRFPWQKEYSLSSTKGNLSTLDAPFSNSRNTQLESRPDLQNPERNSQFGVKKKSRLDLIVENLDSSSDQKNAEFEENSSFHDSIGDNSSVSTPLSIPLGIRRGMPPWIHGEKSQETHFELITKTEISEGDQELSNSLDHGRSTTKLSKTNGKETVRSSESVIRPSTSRNKSPPVTGTSKRNGVLDSVSTVSKATFHGESGKSKVSLIIDELKGFPDGKSGSLAVDTSLDKSETSHSGSTIVGLDGSVQFPWERSNGDNDWEQLHKRSNTKLAESTIPEPELQRLRNIALRMKERLKVGPAGVTEAMVENIHKKWKDDEVVKLQFEGPPTLNMKRTHETLERKTGGLVIWRSGRSAVLYRGMAYNLPCVQVYSTIATDSDHKSFPSSNKSTHDIVGKDGLVKVSHLSDAVDSSEGSMNSLDIDSLLDQLGPRYEDWAGCNPLPVDADLLPGVIPGYKPPYRLLPYKTRNCLKDSQMTSLRRLARTMSPHFALGRNRQHQGLARAMVKLWEESALAKIAIKRGVPNTCNERIAEELKKLTGGVLLSRNKEYIVFYRGNDYLTPSIRDALTEKQKLATIKHDEEEAARLRAAALVVSDARTSKVPLLAGTLAETLEANTRWGNQPSSEDRETMRRNLALAKHAAHVRSLERKLDFAKAKVRKAERALAKVQEFLTPAELPTDLEIITDEERFLFRKMGLKMRGCLLLGRRGVFDGTVENMHLNWKHRELVKIMVKGKSFAQVKHIAISLEAESGGVLISLDKTTKGYVIVVYRGKNYDRPHTLRPKNLLTRRQALARSIELQRREALNHHISGLQERIEMLKSQLDNVESGEKIGNEDLDFKVEDSFSSDDEMEDEGEEAYLRTYSSSDEDVDYASL